MVSWESASGFGLHCHLNDDPGQALGRIDRCGFQTLFGTELLLRSIIEYYRIEDVLCQTKMDLRLGEQGRDGLFVDVTTGTQY